MTLPGSQSGAHLSGGLAGGSHTTGTTLKAISLVQTKGVWEEKLRVRPCQGHELRVASQPQGTGERKGGTGGREAFPKHLLVGGLSVACF